MEITPIRIENILTRASGYLNTVVSHSIQPYRGCSFGNSLCGVGCYVQHNAYLTLGRRWGSFLDVREGAGESYLRHVERERRWARKARGRFSIFLSSSTEPFLPQEFELGVTRSILEAMLSEPPDTLILQSHSHRIAKYLPLYERLSALCELRAHVSIETDLEKLPGLPPHGSPVEARFEAASRLHASGIRTVITVSPLLPIADPERFFQRAARASHAVVIDHFIGGDGSWDGSRTLRTKLPKAVAAFAPGADTLAYRDEIVAIARRIMPGRVGVGCSGFAAVFE